MKKYESIGELLNDYRGINKMSQADFAASLNVDVRTIQRWENGSTLIKPDKEEELVNETLLPYQLIRNLNAAVPIPTFYDFSLRKYSLTTITNALPEASWFKTHINVATKRLRTFNYETDIDYIERYMKYHKIVNRNLKEVIRESARLLPEMNLIITDDSGFYSGHSIIFPVKPETYLKLKNREMEEHQLTVTDIVPHRTLDKPLFYGFDIAADSNDNNFYLVGQLLRFLRDKPNQEYLYCAMPFRQDDYKINEQIGLKVIWEKERGVNEFGLHVHPRFQEGNLRDFLKD